MKRLFNGATHSVFGSVRDYGIKMSTKAAVVEEREQELRAVSVLYGTSVIRTGHMLTALGLSFTSPRYPTVVHRPARHPFLYHPDTRTTSLHPAIYRPIFSHLPSHLHVLCAPSSSNLYTSRRFSPTY